MLPDEITSFIGKKAGFSIFQVQEEAIRRFADSVDDVNLLYWDEEYAKKTKYGSLVAPPGLICIPWYHDRSAKWGPRKDVVGFMPGPDFAKAGYGRVLDAGVEWHFYKTVIAGDTIRAESIIKDMIERAGKTGKMIFIVRETTYTNQHDQMVAKTLESTVHLESSHSS